MLDLVIFPFAKIEKNHDMSSKSLNLLDFGPKYFTYSVLNVEKKFFGKSHFFAFYEKKTIGGAQEDSVFLSVGVEMVCSVCYVHWLAGWVLTG